jgi:type VI secretion system protein VasD
MKPASAFSWMIFAAGCSSAPPPAKEAPKPCVQMKTLLSLGASARVNSVAGSEGRPVQVRVYLLKNDAHLKNAQFEDVWEHDKETLAEDLIQSQQVTVFPGQQGQRVVLNPTPETRNIAAVALFREPHERSWFVSYDVDPPAKEGPCPKQDRAIAVWLDGMQIRDGEGEP